MSLKDQIKNAKTSRIVDNLLADGRGYKFASDRTRRAWANAAEKRKAQLSEKND
jgi:hypothetical protein